jgi:regulator of ribonuclease activity A
MVVDGGGSLRRALLGDMLAEQAATNQWAGLIIYGCIRDVDQIKATPIGVQAINTIPVRTEKRGLGDIDVPIEIGGIKIQPGTFAYADNNGIIISAQKLL